MNYLPSDPLTDAELKRWASSSASFGALREMACELLRYRASVRVDSEKVSGAVCSAIRHVTELDDVNTRAIADRAAEQLATAAPSIIEMRLCESRFVVLHPNQLYRFTVAPGCGKCAAAAGLRGDE